jgi:hypothetical protein
MDREHFEAVTRRELTRAVAATSDAGRIDTRALNLAVEAIMAAADKYRDGAPTIECWCCGLAKPHHARGLCRHCYARWQRRGFTGPGPGPEGAAAIFKARECADILSLPARVAAERLRVTTRTVERWRALLRAAS